MSTAKDFRLKQRMPVTDIMIFITAITIQIAGISLWPLTRGFTELLPSVAAMLAQLIGVFLLCKLIYKGISLSFLIPLASALQPLAIIFIGMLVYGESASVFKVILLICACVLIGIAGRMK